MICQCFSYIPILFQWYSHDLPYSHIFSILSYMIFPCVSYEIPLVFQWYTRGFPTTSEMSASKRDGRLTDSLSRSFGAEGQSWLGRTKGNGTNSFVGGSSVVFGLKLRGDFCCWLWGFGSCKLAVLGKNSEPVPGVCQLEHDPIRTISMVFLRCCFGTWKVLKIMKHFNLCHHFLMLGGSMITSSSHPNGFRRISSLAAWQFL